MLFGWPSGYSPSTSSLSKIANFLKIFSIFCFQCFYYNTSITYWGSMFSEATFREILLPSSEWEKYLSKRSFTKHTCPWCDNFIILLETSFRIIMFAISIFCLSRCPFLLFLMNWNRSYLRQLWNPLLIYWNLLHLRLQFKSLFSNTPGGRITTFNLIVRIWVDSNSAFLITSLFVSRMSGLEFTMAFTSARNIPNGSSFKLAPFALKAYFLAD